MKVHLVDGTYELFRHYYALPSRINRQGQEVAATRGVVESVLGMIADGATHLAVATDHVVESFRNELWPGYKDGSGIETALYSQFGLLEEALGAAGLATWPMTELEADDGLASGAALAASDDRVEQVLICTPDKDLAQCVDARRVVQFDRRKRHLIDEDEVRVRYGVAPKSIPDYLALVGDSADGFPGLPGWGAKSAATVLAYYEQLENIPSRSERWKVRVRGASRLAATLQEQWERALLFRRIATLVRDAPVADSVDELAWSGATPELARLCEVLEAPRLEERCAALAARR